VGKIFARGKRNNVNRPSEHSDPDKINLLGQYASLTSDSISLASSMAIRLSLAVEILRSILLDGASPSRSSLRCCYLTFTFFASIVNVFIDLVERFTGGLYPLFREFPSFRGRVGRATGFSALYCARIDIRCIVLFFFFFFFRAEHPVLFQANTEGA